MFPIGLQSRHFSSSIGRAVSVGFDTPRTFGTTGRAGRLLRPDLLAAAGCWQHNHVEPNNITRTDTAGRRPAIRLRALRMILEESE